MSESTRRTALAACLALGIADLMTLNLSIFPRVRRRLAEAASARDRRPMVAVAIEGAPPLNPEISPTTRPTSELEPQMEPAMVFFPTNVSRLGTSERAQVDRLARAGTGTSTFIVDGHADARGREAFNDRLGKQRAWAVASRLLKRGVASSRIEVHSYGASRPRATGTDPSSLQRNRRVEIFMRGEAP
jgi:outer membrane protein OmpA-like peptidoglycan-associated protein